MPGAPPLVSKRGFLPFDFSVREARDIHLDAEIPQRIPGTSAPLGYLFRSDPDGKPTPPTPSSNEQEAPCRTPPT